MVKYPPAVLEPPRGAVAREFGALESRKATGRPVVCGGRLPRGSRANQVMR